MKRLVLALVLALVLVGSASAEPLATYEHTFEFGGSGSGSGSGSVVQPTGSYSYGLVEFYQTVYYPSNTTYTLLDSALYCSDWHYGNDYTWYSPGPWMDGERLEQYTVSNRLDISSYSSSEMLVYQYRLSKFRIDSVNAGASYDDDNPLVPAYCSMLDSLIMELSSLNPGSYVLVSSIPSPNPGYVYIYVLPYGGSVVYPPDFTVTMVSEVQEPWFDLFGMRGLTASFTPSNSDEDYFILFAGSDSWVGQNPDKWVWTRVHGSTDKYKIIFSGNEYTWFVKYNDEIQQFSFNYTGEEGVVPPVIVPDPEPEPPEPKPPVDTPGDIDPDIPSMPDLESPDLDVDFTSAFDDYENMTIYQDFRLMVNGFTTSIMPDISTTEFYGYLQQVIAYLQLTMEQLREKYAVPIYNIFASVSAFVPSVCWLVVDVAIIFGLFRFMVHILTGPISTAIRERF